MPHATADCTRTPSIKKILVRTGSLLYEFPFYINNLRVSGSVLKITEKNLNYQHPFFRSESALKLAITIVFY
jgi:hypothetical protein